MIVGAAIAGGTFFLAREFAPPKPPGEVAEKPPADMVKTEDFKKLSDRVDQINSNLSTTEKQVADQPNYGPDLKTIRDRMTELDRTVAAMPAQFDSLNQKVATMSKVEDSTSASQIDGLNKRIAELSQTVSSLKNSPSSTQAATNINTDTKGNDLALGEAIQLFKNRKWAEARDAFIRMQTSAPNDARVWYLSALANGFATNQWEGETRRLVSMGLEKEKMGQTSPATINATLDFLTTPTGKDWLADYRKSISPN